MTDWTTAHLPDLAAETTIVTGASCGIGLETVRAFAAHGAHVVLAVRDEAKGRAAAAAIWLTSNSCGSSPRIGAATPMSS